MQHFPEIQTILAAAIEIIIALFFSMMALDFLTGLVKLWNCSESNLSYQKQQRSSQQLMTPQSPDTPPAISSQSAAPVMLNEPLQVLTKSQLHYTEQAAVDREGLVLLIEKSKQKTIRSAAKQLGIAVRVNGRYQRLDYLRAQIKFFLKSQPDEVRRVFVQLTEQKAA